MTMETGMRKGCQQTCNTAVEADILLAPVFQDKMVLQRGMKVPVWGKARPGEAITVEFAGQKKPAKADEAGCWRIELDPLKADSTPSDMLIRGRNEIRIRDILVGEVWLASGQSNMAFTLPGSLNGEAETAAADYPAIRFLDVARKWSKEPLKTFDGRWCQCNPLNAAFISAIAYFFARRIHRELDIPVGIIQAAWGGTPAEAWTPIEDMKARPDFYAGCLDNYLRFRDMDEREIEAGRFEAEKAERHKDPGNTGEAKGWAKPEIALRDWKDIKIPSYLENVFGQNADGAFWFRRDVDIPPEWAGRDFVFNLGAVDDLDTTYFNGQKIGATGFEVPEWWNWQRVYTVPGRLVRAGKNTIAVRVFDERHGGGLTGPNIFLEGPDGGKLDLAGIWKTRDELILAPLEVAIDFPYLSHIPSYLWNGMISPFAGFALRGVIWHQGENNARQSAIYRTLFKDMITAWRRQWGQGDFPFYYVQLSNYQEREDEPTQETDGWPGLREAQAMALSLPNTGMAVTIDIGEASDIHPRNKQGNGERLALIALAKNYGREDMVYSGPVYRSMKVEGGRVRIAFDHTAGPDGCGLTAEGDKLTGFSICDDDGKFVWAEAEIIGNDEVLVSSPDVKRPVAVRYAWANNPECNLYNGAGLPAGPFRTDDF